MRSSEVSNGITASREIFAGCRARRLVGLTVWAAACLALSPALAATHKTKTPPPVKTEAASACPAPNAQPLAPDAVHGVMSRIQANPKIAPGMNYTVQPGLENLDLKVWAGNLEKAGVNIAELTVQPAALLSATDVIGDAEWSSYIDSAFIPYQSMTAAQQNAYKGVREKISARNGVKKITAGQQEQVFLEFLTRLEDLKKKSEICGTVQFILAERRWFPNGRAWSDKFDNEAMYSRTMAGVVNKVVAAGLGHWLAGVLFIEHTNTDMNQLLPIAVDLATRINGSTGNWLNSHLMLLGGGGFGNQFNGVNKVVCPTGAAESNSGYQFKCKPGEPFDFFKLITRQAGTFSFAYKFFNWKSAPTAASYCSTHVAGCDPKNMTIADWSHYLNDSNQGLGFADLADFVTTNAAAYPTAANVMFIGNSADSLHKMTDLVPTAGGNILVPRPPIAALASLFQNAARKGGGWSGRMFMDAYADQDRILDPKEPTDDGTALFFVDYSPLDFTGSGIVSPQPLTQSLWRGWPSKLQSP